MTPTVSKIVRGMMYPNLKDGATVLTHPHLRGVTDDVIFVTHSVPEDDENGISQRQDGDASRSKVNKFEVEIVMQITKYFLQQGTTSMCVWRTAKFQSICKFSAALGTIIQTRQSSAPLYQLTIL